MVTKKSAKAVPAGEGHSPVRGRILEAAFSAFAEHGFADTSTLEIATRARASKRELYAEFGSKRGILEAHVGRDYDPTDKMQAIRVLHEAESSGHVITGILYVDTSRPSFVDLLNLVDEPLATLPESRVRPSREALDAVMSELR